MEPTRENETKRFEKVGKTSKNTVRRYKDKLVRLRILKEKQKKNVLREHTGYFVLGWRKMGYTKEYTRTHEHVLGQRERNAQREHAFKAMRD